MMKRHNRLLIVSLLIILLFSCFLGFRFGSATLSLEQIRFAIINKPSYESIRIILFTLRLPRVIAGILAGGALAAAGLLLQTVCANGLCAPNIIGVNAGAGFCVMLMLCFFPTLHELLPAAAFVGALSASLLVVLLAFSGFRCMSKSTLVLAGVSLSSLLNAGIATLSVLRPEVLSSYAAFSVGGLSGVSANQLTVPLIMITTAITAAYLLTPKLSLLSLGDSMAQALGIRVGLLRISTIFISALLCAAVVSYAGLLGFVGLIVPHAARRLAGTKLHSQLTVSVLLGPSLVVLSDLLGRIIFAPSELPVGILMAVIGVPFFLFLLLKKRKEVTPND